MARDRADAAAADPDSGPSEGDEPAEDSAG
jgi:hypothetical protein